MSSTYGNWQALADHVREGRARLKMSQRELAEAAGVAFSTIQSIERAEPRTRVPDSVAKIGIALGWPAGRGRQIVDTPPEPPPLPVSREAAEEIRARLLDGDGEWTEEQKSILMRGLEIQLRDDA